MSSPPITLRDHASPAVAPRPPIVERKSYISKSRQERFIVPLIRENVLDALAAHATPGGRALDAGCGGQPFRTAIEGVGMRYFSLDAVSQPGITTDYLCPIDGVLPESVLAVGGFDMILCTELLEHVADWDAAWRNLSRLLRPGGKLIVTCPFFFPLHEEPYDFFRPTLHAISYWATRHGLDPVELRKMGDAWDVIGTAIGASGPSPVSKWPLPWLVGTLASKKRKLACWWLSVRPLARWIKTRDTLYLGNFAVLSKPN
ncbi:MAG TPA: methyltransferase domain-containing protein [Phycisphaerales bacterium]|nr:methyltransferase domain-containing protein [Phycisphaerales bacterium]